MYKIDEYIEGLYEDIQEKVISTRNILSLAKSPQNMSALVQNESLMSALSRVLREDGRRSMELITNIVYIFFCFSNFSEFHPVITANKIGNICLGMTEQELKRFQLLLHDIKKVENLGIICLNKPFKLQMINQSWPSSVKNTKSLKT